MAPMTLTLLNAIETKLAVIIIVTRILSLAMLVPILLQYGAIHLPPATRRHQLRLVKH